MLSPFFAWFLSSAKIRSCLRMRLAFSSSLALAISTSSVTWRFLRSERCIGGGGWFKPAKSEREKGSVTTGRNYTPISARTAAGFNRGVPLAKRYRPKRLKALDGAVNKGRELRFRHGAYLGGFHVAVFEDHQGRDAPDAE